MRPFCIRWQRLVNATGATCVRCEQTQLALQHAITKLKSILRPLGMAPVFETREISEDAFGREPTASNRIWIAGRPLESWVGAETGSSVCCSACGGTECRTLALANEVFEAIPEELILQAALLAAAHEVGAVAFGGKEARASDSLSTCCGTAPDTKCCQ